jgi:hypothetical protein
MCEENSTSSQRPWQGQTICLFHTAVLAQQLQQPRHLTSLQRLDRAQQHTVYSGQHGSKRKHNTPVLVCAAENASMCMQQWCTSAAAVMTSTYMCTPAAGRTANAILYNIFQGSKPSGEDHEAQHKKRCALPEQTMPAARLLLPPVFTQNTLCCSSAAARPST